ncbi:hypothetical protein G6F32_015717 [Rhizopus arrhizus]|nr:hypothetical protein G6F32_015717 [Rhizopus arrhizus]
MRIVSPMPCCSSTASAAVDATMPLLPMPASVAVDRDQVLDVADLARQDDGVAPQAELFGALRVGDGRHDQRVAHHGLGLPGLRATAVFVHLARHQFVVQAAPVHADTHGLVVAAGHFDHLREIVVAPLAAAHVAGVDP